MAKENECFICRKKIGRIDGGRLVEIDNGVIQIGQGSSKSLISFCSGECYRKYKEEEEK